MSTYDCIIIGAGYAGLSASKSLSHAGQSILLLEARPRVGGRVYTQNYPDGLTLDFGGSFLGVQQPLIYALAREYSVETYDMHFAGRSIFNYRGLNGTYSGLVPSGLKFWELLDFHLFTKKFEKLAKTVDVDEPWKTHNAVELDDMTLNEWVRKNTWTKATRDAVTVVAELIWGAGTAEYSVLHALFYTKSGVSLTNLVKSEKGAQEQLIRGGAQTIANKIHESLGDAVHLDEPVVGVDQNTEGIVSVTTSKGTYQSRHVIFATAPQQVLRVKFEPPLLHQRRSLLQHTPAGSYWKFMAVYETPFWRDQGLSGAASSPDKVIATVFDISPAGAKHGILMSFVVGHKARTLSVSSQDKRKEEILDCLVSFFGPKAKDVTKLVEHTMMDEEYIGGCPVSNPAPGMWTTLGPWLKKPFGRIHWAGTETSSVWNGYIEGAVFSGQRAAKEVLGLLKT